MDINDIWKIALTMGLSVMGWFVKEKSIEIQQLTILVAKTREELAREYMPKSEIFALIIKVESSAILAKTEFHADINRVIDRIDKLCEKMDRNMESKNAQ